MTKLLLFLLLAPFALGQTLERVEPLTKAQLAKLLAAQNAVKTAQRHLLQVEKSIANEHNMKQGNWMERQTWYEWYEFDGKFILLRKRSNVIDTPTAPDINFPR